MVRERGRGVRYWALKGGITTSFPFFLFGHSPGGGSSGMGRPRPDKARNGRVKKGNQGRESLVKHWSVGTTGA